MKNYYFLIVGFLFFGIGNAQIINFPDANFKAKLLESSQNNNIALNDAGFSFKIDSNSDGEIQVSEALLVYSLLVRSSSITNLTGLEYFDNLVKLDCKYNLISSIDLINNLVKLTNLVCSFNQLTFLNLSSLPNLITLYCNDNLLTNLNIKNGNQISYLDFYNNLALRHICADENEINLVNSRILNHGMQGTCIANSYCTFTPGGIFYSIQGVNKLDSNGNGCNIDDITFPSIKFNITDGYNLGSISSTNSGNYYIPVSAGTYTITPILLNPNYFTISPTNVTVTFPSVNPIIQNFCILPINIHNDIEVTIIPISRAVPGYNARYKILYKNKGNQNLTGSLKFNFQDSVIDFVSSNPITTSQTLNNLFWNFTNFSPMESREIEVVLNLNSPMESPPLNGGNTLVYSITTIGVNDETPSDNTFKLNQIVVNSFDPNDKTCLEGATITPSQVGKEVHYMIRFENNGTANAQNIVVKDMIDTAKFDVNSLIPIKGSHSFVTRITNTNKVEFIFENINLPFDDANNDGYVAFKIKTKPTLVLGNTFSNTASIYFDYNFPIVTNPAVTTVANVLSNQDFEFESYFTLSANPAKEILNIDSNQNIVISSISIYNFLGQLVQVMPNAKDIKTIDVSSLKSGNYFVKVIADKGTSSRKFVKE